MTCIVGLVQEGSVYMGGDSAAVSGLDLNLSAMPKVFVNGAFLMGYTSSFRMGQLLQYAFSPPERGLTQNLHAYMVTTFVDGVRDCLKAGGYARKHDEEEEGGQFLIGYSGHLFVIEMDYQVHESKDGYAAVGCGANIALGAMHVSSDAPPRKRVLAALHAAEHFSAGVRGPFTMLQKAA
jgi:ATP-dependent protease HslVU (ClpYQ) peptidase subunit